MPHTSSAPVPQDQDATACQDLTRTTRRLEGAEEEEEEEEEVAPEEACSTVVSDGRLPRRAELPGDPVFSICIMFGEFWRQPRKEGRRQGDF